ncbi:hypothetical protein Tco_0475685 [Tanacetum coccineum]
MICWERRIDYRPYALHTRNKSLAVNDWGKLVTEMDVEMRLTSSSFEQWIPTADLELSFFLVTVCQLLSPIMNRLQVWIEGLIEEWEEREESEAFDSKTKNLNV